jgi:Protein of unknown function (DUF3800)
MNLHRAAFPCPLLSFSGTPVEGESLVYCVFFDESGVSINDPIVVVAGVLVDGNTQWRPIQTALANLRDRYISPDLLPDFKGFHATDMFAGRGNAFSQTIRQLEESRDILRQVIELPSRLHLPVAFGYIRKVDSPLNLKTRATRRESAARHHALASSFCAVMADQYLKTRRPDDLAWAIAEDNTETKKVVTSIYSLLNNANSGIGGFEMFGGGVGYGFRFRPGDIPLSKIISGFHYVSKRDEPLLQLADTCAFVVRRWLQNAYKGDELFDFLTLGRTCKISGLNNQNVGNGMIWFE